MSLSRSGHDVLFATAQSFGPVVEARGPTAVAAGLDWQESAVEEMFPGFLSLKGDEQLRILAGLASEAMASDIVRIARDWQAHIIIRDNSEWGGWIAAEVLEIPSVAYGVIARVPVPALKAAIGSELAALRAMHDLPADPELRTIDGACFLETTPPSLRAFPDSQLDPRVVPIRPVFADAGSGQALPEWVTRPGDPLLFATLGTVFHGNSVLIERLLAAVADQPYRVLLAGADLPVRTSIPANVHLERYVPLSQVLPFCAAVVSHAGRGTTLTALSHGVPLCLLPLSAEQPMTAGPVARAGAAVVCSTDNVRIGPATFPLTDPRRLDPRVLRGQLQRLLGEPHFRARARSIQSEILSLPGPEEVVALVDRLVAGEA